MIENEKYKCDGDWLWYSHSMIELILILLHLLLTANIFRIDWVVFIILYMLILYERMNDKCIVRKNKKFPQQ